MTRIRLRTEPWRALDPPRIEPPEYVDYVYAVVLIWGLGDLASTFFALSMVGTAAHEANPMIRILLLEEPLIVIALKAAVVLYAGVVLLECRSIVERVPFWRLWFTTLVGAGVLVTANNLAVGFVAAA